MFVLFANYIKSFCVKRKAMIYSAFITFIIGLALELMQKFVFVDRDFDYFDLAANALGVGLGLYLILKFEKLFSIFVKPMD